MTLRYFTVHADINKIILVLIWSILVMTTSFELESVLETAIVQQQPTSTPCTVNSSGETTEDESEDVCCEVCVGDCYLISVILLAIPLCF